MQLHESDLVVFNPDTNELLRFSNGDVLIYGDRDEAEEDALISEIVIRAIDLPIELQNEIINQLKKHYEEN